jgi:drug/metabolite transporter (DMT)-like permease
MSWFFLLILGITWGTSYILIKKGLEVFSSLELASLRITLSSLAFLPVFLLRFRRIDWSRWKSLLVVGFAGSGIPAILFAIAQTQLSSSLTGILSAMTPLFTLLIGLLLFGLTFRVKQGLGVLVGLAGSVFLILYGSGQETFGNIW